MLNKKCRAILLSILLTGLLAGCSGAPVNTPETASAQPAETTASDNAVSAGTDDTAGNTSVPISPSAIVSSFENAFIDTTDLFSARDLKQTVDLTDAVFYNLKSDEDVTISKEGVYVLSGAADNVTVFVKARDDDTVQIVLDGVTITNKDVPAIYIKSANKVLVTTSDSDNKLAVSGAYAADGDANLDAVVLSKSDLVLNGTGILTINAQEGNGVAAKDDLKITGGAYHITASADGLEANDSILIFDGDITVISGKDALHSENEDDLSLGYIYIRNVILNIQAADDAIRGTSIVQIDNGTINIGSCSEGIEGTSVQINGGDITIYATDDGINAAEKSPSDIVIEVNGGTINITMADGDTDAFDSNGDIYINCGTINIAAPTSAFDADGTALLSGGQVTVNGERIDEITNSKNGW